MNPGQARTLARTLAALAAIASLGAFAASPNYYPSRVGTTWEFSNGEVQRIAGERIVAGQRVTVLEHAIGGQVTTEDYLVYGPDGVRMVGTGVAGTVYEYRPPLVVYPAPPLQVGSRWSSTSGTPAGQLSFSSRVIAIQGVVTGAGRFNAMVVRQTASTDTGGTSLTDTYFVPGVGTVRIVGGDGSTVDLVKR